MLFSCNMFNAKTYAPRLSANIANRHVTNIQPYMVKRHYLADLQNCGRKIHEQSFLSAGRSMKMKYLHQCRGQDLSSFKKLIMDNSND